MDRNGIGATQRVAKQGAHVQQWHLSDTGQAREARGHGERKTIGVLRVDQGNAIGVEHRYPGTERLHGLLETCMKGAKVSLHQARVCRNSRNDRAVPCQLAVNG